LCFQNVGAGLRLIPLTARSDSRRLGLDTEGGRVSEPRKLALHVSRCCRDDYPDRRLWVHLKPSCQTLMLRLRVECQSQSCGYLRRRQSRFTKRGLHTRRSRGNCRDLLAPHLRSGRGLLHLRGSFTSFIRCCFWGAGPAAIEVTIRVPTSMYATSADGSPGILRNRPTSLLKH